jgi:hypothetical protein
MKKLIALLVVLGFFVGVVSMSQAATVTTTTTTKKVVTKKKKVAAKKKVVAKKVVKKVVKKAVKKAAPAPAPVAPAPPPPPPVAPVPPPAPVAVKAAPAGSLFGWGLNTAWTGTYLNTGKGKINGGLGAKAEVVLDDMFGLGSMVGLSANSVKWKVGLGGLYGVDINGARIKAIPVNFDGVVMLPSEWIGGLSTYVGGGLNYTVYGSGQTSGSYGAEVYVGMLTDLGMGMGKTGWELGWAAVRADGSTPELSAKGLTLSVSQMVTL